MFSHCPYSRVLCALMGLILICCFVVSAPFAYACSGLELTSKEGDPYWFRTCDMDDTYNVFGENGSYIESSYLVSYPAGQPIPFTTGAISPEHTIIGMSFSDSFALLDGINDAGLTGGLLFLTEGTTIADQDVPDGFHKMAAMEGVTWFLSQCKDVDEVIQLANQTCIQALYVDGILGSELSATLHFTFIDANGKSVVLEAADPDNPGRFTVHESIGVMTNSPPYEQQLSILRDYIGSAPELRSKGISSLTLKGQTIEGIPGTSDLTLPASNAAYDRFTRLAVQSSLSDQGNAIPNQQMLAQGSSIFSSINVANDNGKGVYYYEYMENGEAMDASPCYTQYTICYDIARQTLAIRPYDALVWTTLSIEDADKQARQTYPIHRGEEGGTISSLELGKSAAEPWVYAFCGLAAVAVLAILLLCFQKRKGKVLSK